MPPPLLAWQFELDSDHDDGVQVVYASSEARAMIYAGRQSGGGKGDRSPVTRAPQFDQYATAAGENPTAEEFYDEGYSVRCWNCDHMLSFPDSCWRCAENLVEEGAAPDEEVAEEQIGVPVASDGSMYCSERCIARLLARCAEAKLRNG